MAQLTVYKASAGSGKTFTLTVEFIKLLVHNPQNYRNILAVTFTNKATEEMKQRILSQLYGIWQGLKSSDGYKEKVKEGLQMPDVEIRRRAGMALSNLLHNYNYFRVETIDSFFQSVLRNLARELDLTANLRVALNDLQVEQEAVDQLIEQLNKHDALLVWLIDYIQQNIDDDKSWNVIGDIKTFGETIFRDYYKSESKELTKRVDDEHFFPQYIKQLKTLQQHAIKVMGGYAERFLQLVADAGLQPDSFAGKNKGIGSYFRKLQGKDFSDKKCVNATLGKYLADSEAWAAKASPDRAAIVALAREHLLPLLQQAEQERTRQWRCYKSAEVTLRHLNQLRLLSSIERKVNLLNEEANRFLLSNTQQLLHDLIDGSDTPFIFEKTGAQLDHIMIDEFQDTSTVQWQNFKVLLNETMSRSDDGSPLGNLIVGDVKQSIYRWRNGDWKLLNGIEQQFDNPQQRLQTKTLDVNYRSCRNIVEFNSTFFENAAQIAYESERELSPDAAAQILRAYADVRQEVPDGKPSEGLVRIRLLPKDAYDNAMMEEIVSQVDELLAAGVEASDIAILVRAKKHIPAIADYFMQNRKEVKLVSDEAFRLDASVAVTTLVNAIRVLVFPDDRIARRQVEKTFMSVNGESLGSRLEDCREQLLQMTITDFVERLFHLLGLQQLRGQSAYVCCFYDQVAAFAKENGTDLPALLTAWDEELHKKTILSSSVDGIRLISVHKSKGLEFDNVIVPFSNWMVESDDTLWCRPQEEPFSQLPLVPVDCSSVLTETIYRDDYADEHLQTCVDHLNLLYVAFTRAARNLFVIGMRDARDGFRSALIQKTIEQCLSQYVSDTSDDQGEPFVMEYGQLALPAHVAATADNDENRNVFLRHEKPLQQTIESFEHAVEFRQSNRSREFVMQEAEGELDEQTQKQVQYVKMGNVMHSLFSQIRTTDDIPAVLRRMEFEGILYDDDISADKVRTMMQKRLSDSRVASWFSPRWQLFNECSIISIDDDGRLQQRRPDRVMTDGRQTIVVDFKFGAPRDGYKDQVRQYMSLLQDMGMPDVSGYLWYVYSNKVEEVR